MQWCAAWKFAPYKPLNRSLTFSKANPQLPCRLYVCVSPLRTGEGRGGGGGVRGGGGGGAMTSIYFGSIGNTNPLSLARVL